MEAEVGGTTSYNGFIKKYTTKKGKLHKNYESWRDFLLEIKAEFEKKYFGYIAPTNYLLLLYSIKGKKLTIKKINKLIKGFGKYKNWV